jgi:hypothetical protein
LSLKTKVDGFLQFSLKTGGGGCSGLASKPVEMVSPVWPKNQGGGGFFGLGLKTDSYDLVIWISKSP